MKRVILLLVLILSLSTAYAAPQVKSVRLYIDSIPGDSVVYVDGEYRGQTPITIRGLSPGLHEVKISKQGYVTYQTQIRTEGSPGILLMIIAQLEPADGSGRLEVYSEPDVTPSVYLDGKYMGTIPQGRAFRIDNVSVGSHEVKLTKKGYLDNVSVVDIFKDDVTVHRAKLQTRSTKASTSSLADLTTSISILPQPPAGKIIISVKTANIGTGSSKPAILSVYGDMGVFNADIASLEPGQSATSDFAYGPTNTGTYTITSHADDTWLLNEPNEQNNYYVHTFNYTNSAPQITGSAVKKYKTCECLCPN